MTTFDELDNAINKLSKGKAAGSDGIPNEVWKSLSVEQKLYLLDSFNLSYNTCSFPENWSEVVITPIFKKGDKKDP
jgi:hypothetical protein